MSNKVIYFTNPRCPRNPCAIISPLFSVAHTSSQGLTKQPGVVRLPADGRIRAGLATTPEESPFTSGRDRIRSMIETSTTAPPPSDEEDRAAKTCDRPDAWLCELTIHESAAEFACATVVGAASIPDESASRSGESATAATVAVDEVRHSADCRACQTPIFRKRRPRALCVFGKTGGPGFARNERATGEWI